MENSEINYELLDVMGFDFSKPEDSFINYEREIDNIDFNKLSDRKTSVSKKLELSPELCSILRDILQVDDPPKMICTPFSGQTERGYFYASTLLV